MKAIDFVEEVAELLSEDFTYSPQWTKAELFKDLQVVLWLFGELTQLVDRCGVELVDYLTGEVDLPDGFGQTYLGQYSQEMLDIVPLGESEFLDEDWMADGAGDPKGMLVWGSGDRSKARFVPRPSTVEVPAGGGTGIASLLIADSGANVWALLSVSGVLTTVSSAGVADSIQVIEGYGAYWDLGITTSGELTLTASTSTTSSNLVLNNSVVDGRAWSVVAGLEGVLVTDIAQWGPGLCTGVIVTKAGVDVYQTGNSDYGILVDAYATGSATTPDHVVKMDRDYGFVQYCGQYLGQGTFWYKGLPQEVYSTYNEMVISAGLLPVIKHGVLARAFSKDCDGQDKQKSKLLGNLFISECYAIKDTFGKRW